LYFAEYQAADTDAIPAAVTYILNVVSIIKVPNIQSTQSNTIK